MLISDIMSRGIVTISPEETADAAARLMSRHNVGSLPVCGGDGVLRGIVTDRDIVLRCIAAGEKPETTKISDIMSRSVVTAEGDDTTEDASRLMRKAQVRRIPILENGRLVGMLALGDLAMFTACDTEASMALTDISSNLHRH